MALQFQDVFARVRAWRGKEEGDAAVDRRTVRGQEIREGCVSRLGESPEDTHCDFADSRPGYAHDTDPAAAGRSGHRGDRVGAPR